MRDTDTRSHPVRADRELLELGPRDRRAAQQIHDHHAVLMKANAGARGSKRQEVPKHSSKSHHGTNDQALTRPRDRHAHHRQERGSDQARDASDDALLAGSIRTRQIAVSNRAVSAADHPRVDARRDSFDVRGLAHPTYFGCLQPGLKLMAALAAPGPSSSRGRDKARS